MGTVPPKKVNNANAGDADHVGGNDWDDVVDFLNDVDKTGPVKINTETRIRSGKRKLMNPANTFGYVETAGAISADIIVNEPVLTGTDTRVYESHTTTLTNKTLDSTCDVSAATGAGSITQIPFDYVIFKSGSDTVAYNTATRANQYTSSDARTTFKNVVAALVTAGGGSCFVKKGTYTMVSAADNITMQDNQEWVGEDRDLTILINQSTTDQMWKRTGGPLVEFKMSNMSLKSAGNQPMIYTAGSTDCEFDNCVFEYTSAPASPNIMTFFDNVSDTRTNARLIMHNCQWIGDADGQDMLGLGDPEGSDFSHNIFMNSSGQGIGVGHSIGSRYCDNYFYNIGSNGIGFESLEADGNTITGNIFVSCGLSGVKLSQLNTATNKSHNNVCSNNNFQYCKTGIENGWGLGDNISNNNFYRLAEWGIKGTMSQCIINGNTFYECNYSDADASGTINTPGIWLSNNSNFTTPGAVIINNNYFYTARADFTVPTGYLPDGGETHQGYLGGIFIDTNNTGVIIGFNNVFDNTYNEITDNGTVTTGPILRGVKSTNVTKVNTDSPYTLTSYDYVVRVDATSGAITLNLPTAVGIAGRIYTIIRTDIIASTNIVTIDASSTQTIDGLLTWKLRPAEKVVIQSDGTNWITLYHPNPSVGYFYDKGSTDDRLYVAGMMGTSNGLTTGTTSPAANTLWALPFIVGKVTKFDTIVFEITTAEASQNANAGIYHDNGNCYPGTLMFNTGSISTASTGYKDTTITASLQIFQPGLYWLAWETSATTCQIRVLPGGNQAMGAQGYLHSNWGTAAAYGYSVADTYGATLPDPYPGSASRLTTTPSASVPIPALGLRAV